MPINNKKRVTNRGDEYYKVYEEHSKVLKTWLVAYGAGAPALILGNSANLTKFLAAGCAAYFLGLFFFGAACQVLMAVLNKYVMWACYYAEQDAEFELTKAYKFANRLSHKFWIDVALDLISIAAMGLATFGTFYSVFFG